MGERMPVHALDWVILGKGKLEGVLEFGSLGQETLKEQKDGKPSPPPGSHCVIGQGGPIHLLELCRVRTLPPGLESGMERREERELTFF